MKFYHFLALGFFLGNISCHVFRSSNRYPPSYAEHVKVVGHRGEAAHFPENSIEGFLSAVEKGVDAIEMDVVISADRKVVVSHEAYMSADYMLDPEGKRIPKNRQFEYNLFEMPYDSIRKFDSGTRWNKKYPRKKKISTYKPLLEEVIDSVKRFTSKNRLLPITYMVELKSRAANYNIFQPPPAEFIELVMKIIKQKAIKQRSILMSFDPFLLNTLHHVYPDVTVSYLVSANQTSHNLERLNFIPDIYSPRSKLVKDKSFVDSIRSRNMKLIPWTVNKKRKIKKLLELRVDGIITDYPRRVLNELDRIP